MKKLLLKFVLRAIIATCVIGNTAIMAAKSNGLNAKVQDLAALQTVSTGLDQFAEEFYKETSGNLDNNLICSPISASIVLSMTAHGASGNTETQMRTSLHLPNDHEIGLRGFETLIDSLNNVKNVELSVANKIFVNDDLEVKPEFKDITKNNFKSEIQKVDFSKSNEASTTINTWCKEKTKNIIENIVTPDDLQGVSMILINAVYFKGIWKKKFNPTATMNKTFNIDENTTVDIPMMTQRNELNYGVLSELDAKFVELPYKSENKKDSTSMFIIRPEKINGLKEARDNIEKIDFKKLHDEKNTTRLELSIPKFNIESTLNLKPTLINMGMTDMFNNANFNGISDSPLSVAKVIQKAFIEVNEEGSKAAAATAISMSRTAMHLYPEPIELTIDRPFIYVIYHALTNSILFQGHVRRF